MIRSLRRRHRASVLLLALLLPAAYVAALSSRPQPPAVRELAGSELDFALGLDAFGRLVLELDASGAPVIPDALVYWAPDAGAERERSAEAVLLGALPQDAPHLFSLPYAARQQRGVALVYSLAWNKRVAALALDERMAAREPRP